MKLLLDEIYTAVVAEQLRERNHDVVAVAERADLRGTPDEDLARNPCFIHWLQ